MMKKGILILLLLVCSVAWSKSQIDFSKPHYSDAYIADWVKHAATTPFNFDYRNYTKRVKKASTYFTEKAWKQFLPNLTRFGSVDFMRQHQIYVSATTRGSIQFIKKGVLNGHFSWKVSTPVNIYFQGIDSEERQQVLIATIIVSRVEPTESHNGLVIISYRTTIHSVVKKASPQKLAARN